MPRESTERDVCVVCEHVCMCVPSYTDELCHLKITNFEWEGSKVRALNRTPEPQRSMLRLFSLISNAGLCVYTLHLTWPRYGG